MDLTVYAMDLIDQFGRDKFKGALRAYRCLSTLLKAAPEDWTQTYLQLRESCLNGTPALAQHPTQADRQEAIDLEPQARMGRQYSDAV